ncbi:MAG TPA: transposase [Gemmataceae bacterium]|jgi:putative transposase
MPNYRRNYVPGGTYFFTVVAFGRRPILTTPAARRCLREAFATVQHRWPFSVVAIALLPDHLHTIWTLPEGQADYSVRWQRIKDLFTQGFLDAGGASEPVSASRRRRRERQVWQRRFWEHTVRDEDDLKRCADYVHWNPVKHGLVGRVRDYPWSSFHRFVRAGEYEPNWGSVDPCPGFDAPEWE